MTDVFLYRLHAPRPDFASTMSDTELGIMAKHAEFWSGLMAEGKVLIFTPVPDPAGDWGMAVVLAPEVATVNSYGERDPAVTSGVMHFSVLELPYAVVPERASDCPDAGGRALTSD